MANTVDQVINDRRAVRKFSSVSISDEVLDRIVNLALEAPSAFNSQLRDIVVVRDQEVKQAIYDAGKQQQFLDAPVVFVFVGRSEKLPEDAEEILGADRAEFVAGYLKDKTPQFLREAGLKDASLAAAFLMIAAQNEGVATSPTTGWDEQGVKEAIGIGDRDDRSIALVIAAGYPAEEPAHPGRAANRRVNDRY
ncbi:dehydrogenase [Corynebacterium sp. 319]|uniref:nitroreductase family protein n=1 Tax=unclassified Corynebacterium TaxID=2624378 RepID=UPI00125CAB81|nr:MULTISPECIES: nitroreductase family protein [unclassified Corynebacterium]KAB1550447.1 dehydrogenase [Corynebacterium sp. 319]KAB1554822.1 dehydrogenase [Corynebacterium sp. 321]KAB3539794.1 dehydrogenase [Corynebacterium sp. 366]